MRPGDVVIVNTGWHHKYEDSEEYFCQVARASCRRRAIGSSKRRSRSSDTTRRPTTIRSQPRSARIATARCIPHLAEEYKEWSGGRDWKEDFPEWEPVHRKLFTNGILGIENVGGDLDAVTGKRVTFAFFPWNWDRGDGCIIRLVAMVDPSRIVSHRKRGGDADARQAFRRRKSLRSA